MKMILNLWNQLEMIETLIITIISNKKLKKIKKNRKIINDIRNLMKFRNTNAAFGLDKNALMELMVI